VAAPWRNGGGITREIAAWPPGATLGDFDWRVSMAEVRDAGPFSRFPGVDRVLTVVRGTLALSIEGRPPVMLTAEALPFGFAGDDACIGAPVGGPVLDLNVMARRERFSAHVLRISNADLAVPSATCVLMALSAGRLMVGTGAWDLDAYDALLLQDEGGAALVAPGAVVIVSFAPR
jgi:uncharacterized protein